MDHQLLRLGVVDGAFAMEPSDIKSFRILEDGEVLYEGEKGNFRSYKSDIKERLNELKPRIDEYRMLRHQYEMMEEMRRSMDENNRRDDRREDLDHRDYRDRVNEPDFNIPNPVEKFAVEITLDHPYWKSFYKETGAPKFNSDQPSTIDYLDDYTQKTEGLHALAQNLMQIIDPQAQEKVIDPMPPHRARTPRVHRRLHRYRQRILPWRCLNIRRCWMQVSLRQKNSKPRRNSCWDCKPGIIRIRIGENR